MSTETTRERATNAYRATRTGPVARLARLALAGGLGWVAYDLWIDRMFIFASTDPLSDPGLWILTALVVYGVHGTADLVGWGKRALAVLAVLVVASAAVALAVEGTVWTGPLTWLVWGLDVVGVIVVAVLLLVAVGMGTPGCEIGVVRELDRRRRGEPGEDRPVFCLAGLRALDAWERRMPWHRAR
ncbi:MAG: hypothetical protein GEU81_16005 [Nitriliruptorales bacterium]|nr:hypothetical protein [Nitriliruptorales bacterium]